MRARKMFDVIVVGGGPGGSGAAKKCAQKGFKTLILEKKRPMREKVCSGLVMGPWAKDIIRNEFGDIPREVLVAPYYLSGILFHLPEVQPKTLALRMPLAWRRDLDFWMNQGAKEKGVEIWYRSKVIYVAQKGGECTVLLEKDKTQQELRARFIIGADGAGSVVRKFLFPKLKARYSVAIRECYKGSLDIEKDYIHMFFPKSSYRPRFDVVHKGQSFLIEGSGIRVLKEEIRHILANYGLDQKSQPLWKDGCLVPLLHNELISGLFSPSSGNILLIGDAAGLIFPITFEGIGSALKSGILAADSINEARKQKKNAESIYLQKIKPSIQIIKKLYLLQKGLEQEAERGTKELSKALKVAYEETFEIA